MRTLYYHSVSSFIFFFPSSPSLHFPFPLPFLLYSFCFSFPLSVAHPLRISSSSSSSSCLAFFFPFPPFFPHLLLFLSFPVCPSSPFSFPLFSLTLPPPLLHLLFIITFPSPLFCLLVPPPYSGHTHIKKSKLMDTLPYLITSCTGIPTAETDSLLNSTTTSHHLQCNMGRKAIISSTVSHYLPKDSCKMRDFSRKKKTHTHE